MGEARLMEGRALLAAGDSTSARQALQLALDALLTSAGEAHPRTREASRWLALADAGRAPGR